MSEESGFEFTYPVALCLRKRRCVVVGGGAVGERKARALWEAGAEVMIVAPEVSREIMQWAGTRQVEHRAEVFTPAHLDGAFLAVVATNVPEVNEQVRQAARERGVLLNIAAPTLTKSDPGDFATMATVRRGELLLALTTGGAGPALTAKLRRNLETQFGPEWSAYVELLRELRGWAQGQIPDAEARTIALRQLVKNEEVFEMVRAGKIEVAMVEGKKCLLR